MNPAVERLFAGVTNPILLGALTQALGYKEIIRVEALPEDLLPPLYILSCVAREFGERVTDDPILLRQRTEACNVPPLARQLLEGATFQGVAPKYPAAALMNCSSGEVRIEYLPVGLRFHCCGRLGMLLGKTPSRALVRWEGGRKEHSFLDKRTGEQVTFESNDSKTTGCALDAPVTPIYSKISDEDHDWAVNAYKILTGGQQ
jgi:hypothetical protein